MAVTWLVAALALLSTVSTIVYLDFCFPFLYTSLIAGEPTQSSGDGSTSASHGAGGRAPGASPVTRHSAGSRTLAATRTLPAILQQATNAAADATISNSDANRTTASSGLFTQVNGTNSTDGGAFPATYFLPQVEKDDALTLTPRDAFWLALFLFVGALTTLSFVQAVRVYPGSVPAALKKTSPKSVALALQLHRSVLSAETGLGLHPCPHCDHYKPPRTHHCSRSQRCVLKYDHYCPWIGQCVGFFNYKLYLLFVFYTHLLTVIVTLTLGSSIVRLAMRLSSIDPVIHADSFLATLLRLLSSVPIGSRASAATEATGFVVAIYAFAITFQMLTLYLIPVHWKNARHNLTTVDRVIYWSLSEEERLRWRNEFDVGSTDNLQQIFGDGRWTYKGGVRVQEGAEHDEQHKVSLWTWVWRLLPLAAYPSQEARVLRDPLAFADSKGNVSNSSASLLRTVGEGTASSYGTAVTVGHSSKARELTRDAKYLGLTFPTEDA